MQGGKTEHVFVSGVRSLTLSRRTLALCKLSSIFRQCVVFLARDSICTLLLCIGENICQERRSEDAGFFRKLFQELEVVVRSLLSGLQALAPAENNSIDAAPYQSVVV